MIRALVLGICFGAPALAQESFSERIFDPDDREAFLEEGFETEEARDRVAESPGAMLRGLDKLTGEVTDMDVSVGETVALGRIQVTLGECRYPASDPAGNAYAWLVIREAGEDRPDFQGWMIASAPALNPLEHPRFDIWVMRCAV